VEKVLFVCLGNICRSTMAEGLFRKFSEKKQLAIAFDSAGTSDYNTGKPPFQGTQEIFKREAIDFSQMAARQICLEDFTEFDWIIAMDHQNVLDLQELASEKDQNKIHLYMEVVPEKENQAVPDPWYTGNFEETYQMLMEGLPYWIARFQTKNQ